MGVDLGSIVPVHETRVDDLNGRVVVVDGYNVLYQFLASIRGADGAPLSDKKGRVTGHLAGFLNRFAHIVEAGVLPAVVWDGRPPEAKGQVIAQRVARRAKAKAEMEAALARGDLATARSKAAQAVRVEPHMVPTAQRLLSALGIPSLHAPSEGEAQAAALVQGGHAYAVASQDYDALLFGAPRLVRNLTAGGRRRLPGRSQWVEVVPERIDLDETLQSLGLTREQLVLAGVLVGTDYLPGGVRGIGPKKAIDAVRKHQTVAGVAQAVKADEAVIEETMRLFLDPEVDTGLRIVWQRPDPEAAVRFLVDEHDFDEARVRAAVARYARLAQASRQKSLFEF